MDAVNTLVGGGYAPLAAMVLAARGMGDVRQAKQYLSCDAPLVDPFRMKDMDLAAGRLGLAISRGEKIAVFGDYDVDGITATCLLTEFIRSWGGDCVPYIPGRLEEGYGLNPIAIRYLHELGVKLIVTVDCGITAVEEAKLCAELGIELVITDHHECKEVYPDAVAVVDPHRPDCTYPHRELSGVGVAFKLAAALSGDQEQVLENCADLVCLGTVADVMPLHGENRVFVAKGLDVLRNHPRPGIVALMKQAGCDPQSLTASSVGYILAPRINAAGRMGKIELALELFLTKDPQKAEELAKALCELNRQRQSVESEIFEQAVSMLPEQTPEAIVLADEGWHQGVVGIVASRMAEEYCCPAILICLDGEHGKASSRSYGSFNLFAALTGLSSLLESYGGHEQAAGFTIHAQHIPAFRKALNDLARDFYDDDTPRTVLDADCKIPPELLSVGSIDSLNQLEPCGTGCPKPILVMEKLLVERITPVGNGRHMRLRLRQGRHTFQAIWFSSASQSGSIAPGETVDVAFVPQVNEYRGERQVQMNVQDIRPSCEKEPDVDTSAYRALRNGTLTSQQAEALLPDRGVQTAVWRYIDSIPGGAVQETPVCLLRKIIRWSGIPMSLGMLLTVLDIFRDAGLLELRRFHKYINVRVLPRQEKADLAASRTMQQLMAAKES